MSKQLSMAPRVLVLHLKRFVPNVEKQRYEKQHQNVEIPLQFNLKSYLREAYADATGVGAQAALGKPTLPARPLAAEVASHAAPCQASAVWEVLLSSDWEAFRPHEVQQLESAWLKDPHGSCVLQINGQNYLLDLSTLDQINKDTKSSRPIRRRELSSPLVSEGFADEVTTGPVYNLRSIVAHEGPSPNSGHYVCYARSEKNIWKVFDDSVVKELPAGQEPHHSLGRKAYILFYVLQRK